MDNEKLSLICAKVVEMWQEHPHLCPHSYVKVDEYYKDGKKKKVTTYKCRFCGRYSEEIVEYD